MTNDKESSVLKHATYYYTVLSRIIISMTVSVEVPDPNYLPKHEYTHIVAQIIITSKVKSCYLFVGGWVVVEDEKLLSCYFNNCYNTTQVSYYYSIQINFHLAFIESHCNPIIIMYSKRHFNYSGPFTSCRHFGPPLVIT